MLTPEQLGALPESFIGIYGELEDYILRDISRRIAIASHITDTAEWQIERLKQLGSATEGIKKQITVTTNISREQIEQMFFDVAQVSEDFYKDVYKNVDAIPISQNPFIQQQIKSLIEQTDGKLKNLTQSMGFSVYENGKKVFKPIATVYQKALDFTQMQVSSGAVDYITATRLAVAELADSGLRVVDFASGHVDRMDVAVRRAVLTGVSQETGHITAQVAKDIGTDIVEVTAHAGARPDHAEWQGGWYSISGESEEYRSLVEVTGYGTGAGLKGWNCRHDVYAVIPGISKPMYTDEQLKNIDPPPVEHDGVTYSYYDLTQRQRSLERQIRKSKRDYLVAEGSGDKDMQTAAAVKLRYQRAEYEKFCYDTELLTQRERTSEYGFGRAQAARAKWAAKAA